MGDFLSTTSPDPGDYLFGEIAAVGDPTDNGRVPITIVTQQGDRTVYVQQQQKGQS